MLPTLPKEKKDKELEVNRILIELTDAIGYDDRNKKHGDAFLKAESEIISLLNE